MMLNSKQGARWRNWLAKGVSGAVVVTALGLASAARAQCEYPRSERGEAPAWLCGEPKFDDTHFLAVGDKSRMPSISLQARLAGKQAMVGVVEKLLLAARDELIAELALAEPPELTLPDAKDWQRVARFKGIKVVDKTQSPGRHLYVLAGVPETAVAALRLQARQEVLRENRKRLKAAVDDKQWAALQQWAMGQESAESQSQ